MTTPDSLHRDRTGAPIDLTRWAELSDDLSYRFLRRETLANGKYVVTIWNGITIPVRLFSTGVFASAPGEGEKLGRMLHEEEYDTEGEALAGHDRLAKEWSAR